MNDDSLTSALSKARIPSANHAFVQKMMDEVGISGYRVVEASESYIAATRRDGLRDLRIHSGYTIGFTTEEEARRVGAGAGHHPTQLQAQVDLARVAPAAR